MWTTTVWIDKHPHYQKNCQVILDLIQIFRARRDKPLASKLAVRFAQGQLFDRATAPLLIVHLCLWAIVTIVGAVAVALIAAAINIHGAIIIIALIPLAISATSAWVSFRLKAGLDRIRAIADGYSDVQLDRLFDQNAVDARHHRPETLSAHNHGMTGDAP